MSQNVYQKISKSKFDKNTYRYASITLILLALPSIYALVYFTGGITYVYSHTMYIPILLAGVMCGTKFGILVGLTAGILLGPIMPLTVEPYVAQELNNWLYRLFIFSLMGFLSGYVSDKLKDNAVRLDMLSSANPETGIPNTNYFRHIDQTVLQDELTLITILINNVDPIIDLLGIDTYQKLLKDLYFDFSHQSKQIFTIQPDRNKLWLVMSKSTIEKDISYVLDILDKGRTIHQVPLYVDYSVGATIAVGIHQKLNIKAFTESDMAARHAQIHNLHSYVFDDGKLKKRSDYELVSSFAKALEKDETFLVYQPKVDLNTGKTTSLEALIRWQHPQKGLIVPDQFIPLIEETKLIHQLTDWVFEKALSMLQRLSEHHLALSVSINVSAKNLYDPHFYERTKVIIDKYKVDLKKLELEITETQIMLNPTDAKVVLQKFSNLGVRISLDDFGSGYSSLSHLTQFPINTIKIDKIFMLDVLNRTQIKQIVSATVALSKELGYDVVAEGIEDADVLDYLKSIGCDYAQGYYFAKPMREIDLYSFLENE